MPERVEINSSVTAADSIQSVGHARDMRSEEAKRQFALELDKKLAEEKKKEKKKDNEDRIIIHADEHRQNEEDERKDQDHKSSPDNEDIRKDNPRNGSIDLMA